MKRLQNLALVLTVTMASVYHVQAVITCAAGYHMPGMTATITCHFHGQISTDQNTGVYITKYRLGAPKDDSGKEVLMCHFSGGSVSVCNPEPGYRFINFNKNNLTIEVPDVSPEFQGRYSCGVVPADSRTVIPCLLVVKEDLEVPYKEAQNDPDASLRHEELHTRVQTTHNVVIVILVAIVMMVAAAAVIYMVIAQKRNWLPFKKATQNQNQAEDDDKTKKLLDSERPVAVEFRPSAQVSVPNTLSNKTPPAPAAVSIIREEKSTPLVSHNEHDITGMGESVEEKKVETTKERKARLEKEDRLRKDELKERLKNASKEEKKQIQKKFDENEKYLKQQRKADEERLKREKKEEKERLEREKKEQKNKT